MAVMQTALSALNAYELMLQVTANNLANLNTPGFKAETVSFLDAFYQTLRGATAPAEGRGGTNPMQIGNGVSAGFLSRRLSQGTFSPTGTPTDLTIVGRGFFAVRKDGSIYFTRDGSFRIDAQGRLVHAGTGAVALGWMADPDGTMDIRQEPVPITLPTEATLNAQATRIVRLGGNLDARFNPGETVTVSFTVFDSLGNPHIVEMAFVKRAPNEWEWEAQMKGDLIGSGTLIFNADGQVSSGSGTLTLTLTNGAASPQTISLDFKEMTQMASPPTANAVFQDGAPPGVLEGFTVNGEGILIAGFSNGVRRPFARIALVTFPNPSGLERVGNNLYRLTVNSGLPHFLPAGMGGTGLIQSEGLEASNVDLARELTHVLIAQRGFQAAARMIRAADEIVQEALNLAR